MPRSNERQFKKEFAQARKELEAEFNTELAQFYQMRLDTKAEPDLYVMLDDTILMRRRLVFKVPGLEAAFDPNNLNFNRGVQPLMVTVDGAKLLVANPVMHLHYIGYVRMSHLTDETLCLAIEGMKASRTPSKRPKLWQR